MQTIHEVLAKRFSHNLKEIRIEAGLSQEQLAKRLNTAPLYIYQLEKGDRKPSLTMVERCAEGLKIDPARLLKEPV